jgi:shikimate dehydrogenase
MYTIDHYAVFGYPVKHSKSPRIHQLFAKQTGQPLTYTAEEVPAEKFEKTARAFFQKGGNGLNCTVPLKELAFKFADRLTERARFAKAVNTLAAQIDGSILGDNTDGIGLVTDLTINQQISLNGKRILILGAGGATRGIMSPLMAESPAELIIANRTVEKAIALAKEFQPITASPLTDWQASEPPGKIIHGCGFPDLENRQFDLILNATSASLSNELPPLPDNLLAANACCYDLAYSNEPTAFVVWGKEHHALKSLDGLGMLVEQAAEAFYLWRGVRPETQPVIELLNSERM